MNSPRFYVIALFCVLSIAACKSVPQRHTSWHADPIDSAKKLIRLEFGYGTFNFVMEETADAGAEEGKQYFEEYLGRPLYL